MKSSANLLVPLLLALFLNACSKPVGTDVSTETVTEMALVPQDILTLATSELSKGPMISGTLQPVIKAELNAEVGGIVTRVLKDNGDLVNAGDVLVQLDQTTFRDKLLSAQEAERAAQLGADQAQRQLKRMQQLNRQNLVTAEVLEAAEIKANQTQSDLASAKARAVEARQQLERTEVKAPFAGVVAVRKVSAGDTAQIGKALMVLINPESMRFEGFIAADQVGSVKIGAPVSFRVNGYAEQRFAGEIERINPQANELTRQVQVFVKLATQASFVAGLYAEGFISVAQQQSLMLPPASLVHEGDQHFVWLIDKNKLTKTEVVTGAKDPRFGTIQVLSGLTVGQQILRHPQGALRDGITVTIGADPTLADKPTEMPLPGGGKKS
jgi:membrane fusion protein (multidrug efflux system)